MSFLGDIDVCLGVRFIGLLKEKESKEEKVNGVFKFWGVYFNIFFRY